MALASMDARTTVMLRYLPNNYTADLVLQMLDNEGFSGLFDFFYLPIDLKTQAYLGYAFINLVHPSHVYAFWQVFNCYADWVIPSRKICQVTWSEAQGRQAFEERYRNSPLLHHSVADSCKPRLFQNGRRIPFTPPTKPPK